MVKEGLKHGLSKLYDPKEGESAVLEWSAFR